MDTVIQNVANELLAITNTQILAKGDVFNNLDQTQIRIGKNPAFTQAANSIILNATGANLSNTIENSCVIKPIRNLAVSTRLLSYNDVSGEIVASSIEQTKTALEIPNRVATSQTGVSRSLLLYNTGTNVRTISPALNIGTDNTINLNVNDGSINSRVMIGGSSGMNFGKFGVELNNDSVGNVGIVVVRAGTGICDAMQFRRRINNSPTVDYVGGISISSTATTYVTGSDYRLKNVIGEITDASTRVLALKPIRFQWKLTGEEVDGFLAHEAQEVVPEAVTGQKDAVDGDGNPLYQGIDQSKLVPLLTAALQDALKRIEVLETQINNNVV
jgi:hypothetical protein